MNYNYIKYLYDKIIYNLKTVCSIKELPIIAIGGIELEDVPELMRTGVFGIAVSGLLTHDFGITDDLKNRIELTQEICYK